VGVEVDLEGLTEQLEAAGVVGVMVVWADNNGIPRSRTVPVAGLGDAISQGIGITPLFAVFDSHDAITFEHEGLATPSGDIRLRPVVDRLTTLAGQPAFAWAPGRQLAVDGSSWPYDQRGVLEAQVARAAEHGLSVRVGYELEFFVARSVDPLEPAHRGPAYSPHALLEIDEFVAQLLRDLDANGLRVGQVHAEYGHSQVELSLADSDPVHAADDQLLARQTIHAAARTHALRVSFAPLVTLAGVGNGWHIHASAWRDGQNLLAGAGGPDGEGGAFVAGLLRDLPAITAISAPSVPSLMRLRPGYFASAYAFWGVENREAALRYVPGSKLAGVAHANVELKPSDASANPYLAIAALIAAGVAGVDEGLTLPDPIEQDPGRWTDEQREHHGVVRLPETPADHERALLANPRIRSLLGEPLLGAFLAVRHADATWAAERPAEEVVAAHLWRY
jgi:glutamine synthetase